MKILLSLILALVLSGTAWATPAYVRGNAVNGASATVTIPATNAGDEVLVGIELAGGSSVPSTLSDSAGNTYTQIVKNTSDSAFILTLWGVTNAAASASTNTITTPQGAGYARYVVAEYSGVATSGAVRSTNNNYSAGGNSLTTGSMTTVSGDLVLGYFFANGSSVTADGAYASRTAPTFTVFEDKITSTTSENPPSTTTGGPDWASIGIVLEPAVAAAPGNVTINKAVINHATIN